MKLTAFFSITGRTRKAAEKLGFQLDADLFEIQPLLPYTAEDLDWENKRSRCSQEMHDMAARPQILSTGPDMAQYEEIYIGFPIWFDEAPRVINTFLEMNHMNGKKINLFATSEESGIENAAGKLKEFYPYLDFEKAVLVNSEEDIRKLLQAPA